MVWIGFFPERPIFKPVFDRVVHFEVSLIDACLCLHPSVTEICALKLICLCKQICSFIQSQTKFKQGKKRFPN